ncbi:MAG: hypothetical protein IPJ41_11020 [Phycisphaerales bacterium]|nr:hypothetical protein [Phycisphaerales bacterium]
MLARSLPIAALLALPVVASAQLLNPSFETAGTAGHAFANWEQFGGNIYRVEDPLYQLPYDGDALGKVFGNFDGQQQSDSGIYQFVPASAGEQWTGSINVLHRTDDALQGGNLGLMVLSWQDANGAEISTDTQVLLDANSETDFWYSYELSGQAPAGTARIGFYVLFLQFADDQFPFGAPGAMFFDLAGLEKTGGGCAPDINGDGAVNTQDFIAFLNLWVAKDSTSDWNNDGVVNTQDFVAFLNDWVAGC